LSNPQLILLGAGGGTRELLSLMRHAGQLKAPKSDTSVYGILDDDSALLDHRIDGVSVLGPIDHADRYPDAQFLCGIASNIRSSIRCEIADRLALPDDRWATFVHPRANVADSAVIGVGSIIYPGACVSCDTVIGKHVTLYYHAVIHHDINLGDGCIACASASIAGHVTAGRGCYFGIGCSVRERIKLGDGVLVGMGAAVISDVSSGLTVVGVPARPYSPPHDSVTQ
jgi:sugar O-acyltransferase (sialic acid O-acetyltransferase NeuD family)